MFCSGVLPAGPCVPTATVEILIFPFLYPAIVPGAGRAGSPSLIDVRRHTTSIAMRQHALECRKLMSGERAMSRSSDDSPSVPDERRQAWGESYRPRYSGVATFMRRELREQPEQWEDVDIGIVGVPFDGAVTNRPGARHGPRIPCAPTPCWKGVSR